MKSVYVSILIGFIMIIGGLFFTLELENTSKELLSYNNELTQNVINENYDNASKTLENLKSFLLGKQAIMESTGKHCSFDDIEVNVEELKAYLNYEMKVDALAKCMALKAMFEDLPKNSRIKLANIL